MAIVDIAAVWVIVVAAMAPNHCHIVNLPPRRKSEDPTCMSAAPGFVFPHGEETHVDL